MPDAQCNFVNRMNVEPELNTKQIKCKRARCREIDLLIGTIIEDGQAIEIGNVRIWHEAVLCCSNCHRVYRFEPKNLGLEV